MEYNKDNRNLLVEGKTYFGFYLSLTESLERFRIFTEITEFKIISNKIPYKTEKISNTKFDMNLFLVYPFKLFDTYEEAVIHYNQFIFRAIKIQTPNIGFIHIKKFISKLIISKSEKDKLLSLYKEMDSFVSLKFDEIKKELNQSLNKI